MWWEIAVYIPMHFHIAYYLRYVNSISHSFFQKGIRKSSGYTRCFFCESGEWLFHWVLQSFGRSELWNSHCWNLYSFTSSWVSCFSRVSHLCFKDTKTGDWNLCPVFHCCFNAAEYSIYCSFSVSFCSVKYFVHFADDVCFIHSSEFISLRAINLCRIKKYLTHARRLNLYGL